MVYQTALQVLGLLLAVLLCCAWLYSRQAKITMLSLAVRGLYWYARWMQNLAVNSDRFLLQWREYRADHKIRPLNEVQQKPQVVQIESRVAAQ